MSVTEEDSESGNSRSKDLRDSSRPVQDDGRVAPIVPPRKSTRNRLLDPQLIPSRLTDVVEKRTIQIADPTLPTRMTVLRNIVGVARLCVSLWLLRFRPGAATGKIRAFRLRCFFENLGGLWIKTGQLLSLRRDLFSAEVCDELSRLLDSTDGFPYEYIRSTIVEDLGAEPEELFDEFQRTPFASASVGQIHLAKLRDTGVRIAIKVRRPYIEEIFEQQFALIKILAGILSRIPKYRHLRSNEVLSELRYAMSEEIDYRIESSNIRRMRQNLRAHNIYVPNVYHRMGSKRLLVMEYLEGALVSDYIKTVASDPEKAARWRAENNVDGTVVARRLYHSMLRQMYEDNLFHGDLHPGNIILLKDSKVALIDFGNIGFTESEFLERYAAFFRAIAFGNYSRATDILFLMFSTLPNIDVQPVRERFIRAFRAWEVRTEVTQLPFHQRSVSSLVAELVAIAHSNKIATSWLFLRLEKAGITLDMSLCYLYPRMKYPSLIRAYFKSEEKRNRPSSVAVIRNSISGLLQLSRTFPSLVDDYSMFHVPMMRRQSVVFQRQFGKMGSVMFIISREFGRFAKLALFLLVFALLQRSSVLLREYLPDAGPYLPDLPWAQWALVAAGLLYVIRLTSALCSRLEFSDDS